MTQLRKIAEKLILSEQFVKDIIVAEHELLKLTPKSKLVEIDINLDSSALKRIDKISKGLKVTYDAIVCAVLIDHIEKRKKDDEKAIRPKTVRRKRRNSKK